MFVLSIKVPIQKKSGNLFDDPRIYILQVRLCINFVRVQIYAFRKKKIISKRKLNSVVYECLQKWSHKLLFMKIYLNHCLSVCVCVYIYIYIYIFNRIGKNKLKCIRIYDYENISSPLYTYRVIHINICIDAFFIYENMCIYIYIYICKDIFMNRFYN